MFEMMGRAQLATQEKAEAEATRIRSLKGWPKFKDTTGKVWAIVRPAEDLTDKEALKRFVKAKTKEAAVGTLVGALLDVAMYQVVWPGSYLACMSKKVKKEFKDCYVATHLRFSKDSLFQFIVNAVLGATLDVPVTGLTIAMGTAIAGFLTSQGWTVPLATNIGLVST